MFCPLSNPAFANHFDACKSRIKQKMHRKIDKMVDRVYEQALSDLEQFFTFDQSRLTKQRVDTSSNGPSLYPCSYQHQSTTFIPQNGNNLTNIFVNPTLSHFYPQHNGPILIDPRFTHQSFPIPPVPPQPVSITNAKIILHKKVTNFESCQLPHKLRFKIARTANEPMDTVQAQHPPPPSSLSSSIVNEQTNNNLNDEVIWECDDCQNGIDEDDDDDDESVQWIDDQEDEESTRPMKKPRMGTTQLNDGQSSVTRQTLNISTPKQTHEPQPNEMKNHNPLEGSSQSPTNQPAPSHNLSTHGKQVITLSLQCPNCPKTFPQNLLNDHMKRAHSIGPFRCAVKDCGQAFDNSNILGEHIKNIHQPTITKWLCGKCPKQYTAYKILSGHTNLYHKLGHFQCSFPHCTFTAECKIKVQIHYTRHVILVHKPAQNLHCEHCNYRTNNSCHLKTHQRIHSGIKPYRCKWPKCHYACTVQHNTICHIQRMHFARNSSSSSNGAQHGHPKDYVEVLTDLL